MPKVILVNFHTDAWRMPGMPKAGVYPIFPTKRTWYIDGYRKDKAVLGVERNQFPLAPAFACTAHQAQGSTQEAVIAVLLLGRGVSSIASYIAITRVKSRAGLLIISTLRCGTISTRNCRRYCITITSSCRRTSGLGIHRR